MTLLSTVLRVQALALVLAAAPLAAEEPTVAVPDAPGPDFVAPESQSLGGLSQGGFTVLDANVDLSQFLWVARPVVVFADTPNDPRFLQQMELLAARPEALAERDVVVIADTDPAARSEIRLKLRPRGFSIVLIDKDGQVELRKPVPWDVRELSRAIDKTPLRRQEIRDAKRAGEG
ncbi:MAG: DUF4174 domain-containing protein [Rhodobacteraceae bacterium]|nr:DUF4174 domain-containing protein [Paracoccaceae bacterium]